MKLLSGGALPENGARTLERARGRPPGTHALLDIPLADGGALPRCLLPPSSSSSRSLCTPLFGSAGVPSSAAQYDRLMSSEEP